MERRNFIKSSLGIGLGATLPGMTHSKKRERGRDRRLSRHARKER